MSNVVNFLEALSLDPGAMSEAEFRDAVRSRQFDAATEQALLEREPAALRALFGAQATVVAFIMPAEDEPDSDSPDTQEPDHDPTERDHESHSDAHAA